MITATRASGPIVIEGQKADGLWYPESPGHWQPMRFTLLGRPVVDGTEVEILIQHAWLRATFGGVDNGALFVNLTIALEYHEDPLEPVYAPSDATFRWPGGPAE